MSIGTIEQHTASGGINGTLADIVTSLNAFLLNDRRYLFGVTANAAKQSTRDTNKITVRILSELVGTNPVTSLAGREWKATGFSGTASAVQTAYELFFTTAGLIPYRIYDLTTPNQSRSDHIDLLVVYYQLSDNGDTGAHLPEHLFLVKTQGVINAGATGNVKYIDADGTEQGTTIARNIANSHNAASGAVCYAIVDHNTNEVAFLPSCCGAP